MLDVPWFTTAKVMKSKDPVIYPNLPLYPDGGGVRRGRPADKSFNKRRSNQSYGSSVWVDVDLFNDIYKGQTLSQKHRENKQYFSDLKSFLLVIVSY